MVSFAKLRVVIAALEGGRYVPWSKGKVWGDVAFRVSTPSLQTSQRVIFCGSGAWPRLWSSHCYDPTPPGTCGAMEALDNGKPHCWLVWNLCNSSVFNQAILPFYLFFFPSARTSNIYFRISLAVHAFYTNRCRVQESQHFPKKTSFSFVLLSQQLPPRKTPQALSGSGDPGECTAAAPRSARPLITRAYLPDR